MSFWDIFINKRTETAEQIPQQNTETQTQTQTDTLNDDAGGALLRAQLDQDYVDRDKAMMISAVNGCVSLISQDIAALPIRLYKRTDSDDTNDVEEIRDDRRLFLLNEDPGDTLDAFNFKQALIRDFYLGKGGYAYINRRGLEIESIHYVDERYISFMYNIDPIFKSFSILIQGQKYDPSDFIILLRNTRDGREGLSIQEEAQKLLSVSWETLKFENGIASTGGAHKGFIQLAHKVQQNVINRIKDAWRRLYSNDSENVVVLNEGMSFHEASQTAQETQLSENKSLAIKQICQLFGMPVSFLSGNVTEEDRKVYVEECLQPLCDKLTTVLNRVLLLESEKEDYFFQFDLSDRTRGDILTRFRAYEIASKNGFIQTDEIRLKENLPSLGMDFIKLGLQDVLYDPVNQTVFTPNTGVTSKIDEPSAEPPAEPSVDEQAEQAQEDPERQEDKRTHKQPKRRRGGDRR